MSTSQLKRLLVAAIERLAKRKRTDRTVSNIYLLFSLPKERVWTSERLLFRHDVIIDFAKSLLFNRRVIEFARGIV